MKRLFYVLLLTGCASPPEVEPVDVFRDVYQSLTPIQRDRFIGCMGGGQAFLIELETIKECTIRAVKAQEADNDTELHGSL